MNKLIIPPVFLMISLILTVMSYFAVPDLNIIPFPFNLIGIPISFTGFVIMGKSRDLFKKHQTTLHIKKSSAIIQEGVFAKTRNPMYGGMFLLLLGIGICFRNIFSILIPVIFVVLMHFLFVLKEERLMSDVFGQAYLDYKTKVKRWL
jgi:protein-S-isoprenylcysteine O-methyltransferase Ste14